MKTNEKYKPEVAEYQPEVAKCVEVVTTDERHPVMAYDLTLESTEDKFLVDSKFIDIMFGDIGSQTLEQFKDQLIGIISNERTQEELISVIERTIYMKKFVMQPYFNR